MFLPVNLNSSVSACTPAYRASLGAGRYTQTGSKAAEMSSPACDQEIGLSESRSKVDITDHYRILSGSKKSVSGSVCSLWWLLDVLERGV